MEFNVLLKQLLTSDDKKLIIKNFDITLCRFDANKGYYVSEIEIPIKYITPKVIDDKQFIVSIKRNDTSVEYKLKMESQDDLYSLLKEIEKIKKNYTLFIKNFFVNEDENKLLLDAESIYDFLTKQIKDYVKEINESIKGIKIYSKLENILEIENNFLSKINYYIKIVENNFLKLNNNNENEKEVIDNSIKLKQSLLDLKNIISNNIFGLSTNEINEYLNNFINLVKQKCNEILLISNEIKYYFDYYLSTLDFNQNNINLFKHFSFENTEISKLIVENEIMKSEINKLEEENEIITYYLNKQ